MKKKVDDDGSPAAATAVAVSGDAATDKLLKRNEVAEILGTSVSTVRRMEGSTLRPIVGDRGEHLFHEEHVRELVVQRTRVMSQGADAYDGAMAAIAFELFDAGQGPVGGSSRWLLRRCRNRSEDRKNRILGRFDPRHERRGVAARPRTQRRGAVRVLQT